MIYILIIFFISLDASFSQPFIDKSKLLTLELAKIGKAIVAVSSISAIVMFLSGKPQWKWLLYILGVGISLSQYQLLIHWIVQ